MLPDKLTEVRAHNDSFVKRLHKIFDAAMSANRCEFDRVFEDWLAAHQPASEGSAWLLEHVAGSPVPMWLGASEAPARGWTLRESIWDRFEFVKDANFAVRFSREIDAENMARALSLTTFYVPREHEFVA